MWLSVECEEEEAVIRVRDNGTGIAPDLLPHIFDLFTQAEWTNEQSQGGLGIGLALVRSLVEMHEGAISASSPGPGLGSQFVVRLPALHVNEADLVQRPHDDKPPSVCQNIRRVLVVDDNVDAAQSLATLLQLQGHKVQVAYDGATALNAADEFHPEVVLLDIGLPSMDGHQVARQLRDKPGGALMLIIALTGYGQDEDRQRSTAAGFNAHLLKPVDLDALSQLLTLAFPLSK